MSDKLKYPNDLEENIKLTVCSLEILIKEKCFNKISNNYLYILSEINDFDNTNFHEQRKINNRINNSKTPVKIDYALKVLSKIYNDLYDVNLYVFKAKKNLTVIEIQYYKKARLDSDYFIKVKDNHPMYHAKVPLPPCRNNDSEKFGINWNNGEFLNELKIWIWTLFNK